MMLFVRMMCVLVRLDPLLHPLKSECSLAKNLTESEEEGKRE